MFPVNSNVLTSNTTLSNITTISSDQLERKPHYQELYLLLPYETPFRYDAAIDWNSVEDIGDKAITDFFIKLEEMPKTLLADFENHKRETDNAGNQLSGDTDIDWSTYENEMTRDPFVELEDPPEVVLVDDAENNKGETSDADGQSGLTAASSSRCPATGSKYDALSQKTRNRNWLNTYRLKYANKHSYKCDKCNKTFKREGMLERHKKNHKPLHKCTDCGATYMFLNSFLMHKDTHSNNRPFVCDLCFKGFKTSGKLKCHKKSHSNDRPFVCDICNMAFKQNNTLKGHKKTHSNNRQFTCDICKKGFHRSSDVSRHQSTHNKNNKPFKCIHCNKGYSSEKSMMGHIRQKHPDLRSKK